MEKKPSVMAWLLAACLSKVLLPDVAASVWAAKTGKPVSAGVSLGIGLAALGIGLLCFMTAVSMQFEKERSSKAGKADRAERRTWYKRVRHIAACMPGFFPCLLVFLTILYGSHWLLPVMAAVFVAGKGFFIGITAVLAVLLLLLLGIPFFCWMNGCRNEPVGHPIRRFFFRIYLGIPMAFLLWAALLAVPAGQALMRGLWGEPGILIRHLILAAGSFVMAGLLNGAVVLSEKMMAGAKATAKPEPVSEPDFVSEPGPVSEPDSVPESRPVSEPDSVSAQVSASGLTSGSGRGSDRRFFYRNDMLQLASLLLCMMLFFFQNLPQLTGNEAAMLNRWLQDSLVEYGFYLAASDIGGAAGIAAEAVEQMDAALLTAADARNEAARDASASVLRKAEKKVKALEKVCSRYEIFRADGQALAFLEEHKKYGGADAALAEDALSLSEEYPERLWVQYTASLIGSSLTYDEAKHYDRTAKAVLRCEALYQKEKKPSEEEWTAFEKRMAQMLYKVCHEEEAARILEELADGNASEDAEIWELLAQCYDRTDRLSEAYELAAAYCEKKEDSPYLMYCAALSALKLEKTKECLAYTSKLASYTAGCEGEELNDCDTWLFGMLEFLSLSDSSNYTDFQYDVYSELTEEENADIDANPFFRNYLDAVYLAYRSKHKDEPEEAFQKAEAVLSENPRLASVWYLCGIIASNTDDPEYQKEAVRYYQMAGELNDKIPAVWYAMAREYDRMGEYEKGIEACKKALALLPEQDHGNDWYGINYHCSRLLRSLQAAVK